MERLPFSPISLNFHGNSGGQSPGRRVRRRAVRTWPGMMRARRERHNCVEEPIWLPSATAKCKTSAASAVLRASRLPTRRPQPPTPILSLCRVSSAFSCTDTRAAFNGGGLQTAETLFPWPGAMKRIDMLDERCSRRAV